MPTRAASSTCPACNAPFKAGANFCGVCGSALSHIGPTDDPYIGATIGGRYVIQSIIGRGGMGDVYLAVHEQLGQRVAIKFLPERLSDQPEIVRRFFNEARSTCRVNHPNAVSLNDFGQSPNGALYIIMEYIEGEPLSAIVRRDGRLPLPTILDVTVQICDALYAAHEQSVIHRDLKPDNIMLTLGRGGRYRVKVLDFGIAKLLDEGESGLTQTGTVFGTPEFMSPEQASGEPVDGRSDIYGVAMILYYLVCGGRLPFEGKDRLAILKRQVHEAPTPPSVRMPNLPITEDVEAVIMKGLAKDPDQRFPSMDAFAEALEAIQAGRPPFAAPTPEPPTQMKTLLGIGGTGEQRAVHPPADTDSTREWAAATSSATLQAIPPQPQVNSALPPYHTPAFESMPLFMPQHDTPATPDALKLSINPSHDPPPAPDENLRVPRNRAPAVAIAALVLLALVLGAVYALQQPDEAAPTSDAPPITATDEPEAPEPPLPGDTTQVTAAAEPPPEEVEPEETPSAAPTRRRTRRAAKAKVSTSRARAKSRKPAADEPRTPDIKPAAKTTAKEPDAPKSPSDAKAPSDEPSNAEPPRKLGSEPPKTLGSSSDAPTPPSSPPAADPPKEVPPPATNADGGEPPRKL